MTLNGWLQITFFLGLIFAVTKPLGIFMTKVFAGERTFLDPAASSRRTPLLPRNGRR